MIRVRSEDITSRLDILLTNGAMGLGLCADHTVEVYCDNMLIARVKQGDQPPAVTDRYAG